MSGCVLKAPREHGYGTAIGKSKSWGHQPNHGGYWGATTSQVREFQWVGAAAAYAFNESTPC